jgi:hypothetical protein
LSPLATFPVKWICPPNIPASTLVISADVVETFKSAEKSLSIIGPSLNESVLTVP